ncbi:MAG: DUF433 domain-containing protein [Tychonema bourrellyi B0820]|uniref:DUF433 domain-containing protein n=1 Tax=Tychonema bourrellyi FEM_GT703 TaxID=2040638 RepID=A0A2G4EXV5_9CYAN|nr:DUF433 domain-containing protein [Tychonema bourrellyi]MDQ2098670.1 DUF433 domain-containing protein [Tychonema bourrellyi B0820]PHX54308.1 DUF433 domain-containing protein [Tychonema bourrellyi FEM_GT703]
MTSYRLNLPVKLQQEAEKLATLQGISLDRFILWAVAEKVATLNQRNDDAVFPQITYVRGASSELIPVLRGTRLRVQTVVIAAQKWDFSPNQIATEYDLSEVQVNEILAFYAAHSQEIDVSIAAEQIIEPDNSSAIFP